ncbi:gastric triacylglycerol lipase-like [Acanthaster planci]|uniref:Gastric triacylglycerol lipase-like n=1 Tax=Acanthaster planci TaxID=133434 RepID=A0A8B8A5J5_ACAPL|nr:gastric triacylglycerol lipase-like [Acanthaster planci]
MSQVSVLGIFFLLALVCSGDAWMDWFWNWNSSEGVDPDVKRNASELITSKGYPCEEHYVTTADGFILGLQRIPHGRNETADPLPLTNQTANATNQETKKRPVVFLQHGLLCSSTNWLTNLANESFAYILADAGFDVWLGNVRGNVYSKRHTHLSPDSDEFWDWSWDQMAEFDLPAMVDLALEVSGQDQLYYVGHSQGSLMAFAELSRNKELEKKIKMFFALGPVTTVGHMTSPLRYLSTFVPEIEFLLHILGVRDFMPSSKITQWLAADICSSSTDIWCENIVFVLCGFDRANLNESRMPVYFAHSPSGTSVQNMIHFAQMVSSGEFQMYDYGTKGKNMAQYNQTTPPLYYPENINVPVVLYWGGNDWLADPKDVQLLIPRLRSLWQNVYIPQYDHLDFIWGTDARHWVYEPIIRTIQREESPEILEEDNDESSSSVSEVILEYYKKIEEMQNANENATDAI